MLSTMPGRVRLPPMAGLTCTYKVSTYCNFLPSFSSSLFVGNECEDCHVCYALGLYGCRGVVPGRQEQEVGRCYGRRERRPYFHSEFLELSEQEAEDVPGSLVGY